MPMCVVVGAGKAAGGASRQYGSRQVLPAVYGPGATRRDARDERARDQTHQPSPHRPPAEGDGHQRPPLLRLHGPASSSGLSSLTATVFSILIMKRREDT